MSPQSTPAQVRLDGLWNAQAMVEFDAQGRVVDANPLYLALIGYSLPEIQGQTHDRLMPPGQSAAPDFRHLWERLEAAEAQSAEIERIDRQGRSVWMQAHYTPLLDGDGKLWRVLKMAWDITARKVQSLDDQYTLNAIRQSRGMVEYDLTGRVLCVNERFCELLGHPRATLLTMLAADLLDPVFADSVVYRKFWSDLSAGRQQSVNLKRVGASGQEVWTQSNCYPVSDAHGRLVKFVEIAGDITEQVRSQQQLKLLETCVSRLNDMVQITEVDVDGENHPKIVFVNDTFTRRTGYSRQEVLGRSPRILQGPATQRRELDRIRSALKHWQPVRAELINYTKAGEMFWVELDINPIANGDGWFTHWVAVSRDISQRKQAEAQIQKLAFYDELTELPNRRLLQDRLEHALGTTSRSAEQAALLCIDLDDFKTFNDAHGHHVGDEVLRQAGHRLAHGLRDSDTVARVDGDEFIVLLENIHASAEEAALKAEAIAHKLHGSLGQPYLAGGASHLTTASIGIAVFNGRNDSADEVLKRAQVAMHQAKAAGRNAVRFFDPALQKRLAARSSLEADLRSALERGEFTLYYQPVIDQVGRITGVEALLRWRHPTRGMVSPGEFIPVAETTGLILPIGRWVLQTACEQIARWSADERTAHLTIAVNVSALQFRQSDFVVEVLGALESSGAAPDRLKIELTESMLVDDVETIILKMTTLRDRGIGFSLDDFGTGYSSLSYLKRLPLSQLKIDQSFVRDVMVDANDATIARTILGLGLSLGLQVVAEGVETEGQHRFLRDHGCKAFQGYLFGRPVPVEQLDLARRNTDVSEAPRLSLPLPT